MGIMGLCVRKHRLNRYTPNSENLVHSGRMGEWQVNEPKKPCSQVQFLLLPSISMFFLAASRHHNTLFVLCHL
jgi:hypothetical protein